MIAETTRSRRRPVSLLAAPAVGLLAALLLGGCTAESAPEIEGTAARPGLAVTGDAPTTAALGEEFAPVNVLLADTSGAPVPGADVSFTVRSGDAAFADGAFSARTDASGVATAYGLVAGTGPGSVHVLVAAGAETLDVELTVELAED